MHWGFYQGIKGGQFDIEPQSAADQQGDRLDLVLVNFGYIFWMKRKELYRIALLTGSLLVL